MSVSFESMLKGEAGEAEGELFLKTDLMTYLAIIPPFLRGVRGDQLALSL